MDTDMILNKLAKGLATGGGVFASTLVGDTLDEFVPGGDTGVALGQMALGAGVAVGAERIAPGNIQQGNFSVDANLAEAAVEHVGYGIHGAGFAELADMVQTGSDVGRTVSVRARAEDAQTGQNASQASQSTPAVQQEADYSLDTA
jgi:hypothetical protein